MESSALPALPEWISRLIEQYGQQIQKLVFVTRTGA